jgi:NTE family protein
MSQSRKLKQQQKLMDCAENYSQWSEAALAYDEISGAGRWKSADQTRLYDHIQIRQRLDKLRSYRARHDNVGLLFTLNEGVHGNMGGMGKAALYNRAKFGTKKLIEDYVDEISSALEHIASLPNEEISLEAKLDFFYRASHCYGRSALMLSGGGSLGHFHIGVLKALIEQDLLPNVISGASAGSVVTAIFGTHSDRELQVFMHPKSLVSEAREEASWFNRMLFGKKPQIDIQDAEETISRLIPDLTFQEAYELTGRHINISIAPAELHQTSRLLNAITAPNVYVRSAVMASCAVPGVFPAVTLQAKNIHGEPQPYLPTRKWVDGSVTDDLPSKRLSRMYGVNHYIGSLINPIVLFATDSANEHGRMKTLARVVGHKSVTEWTRFLQMMAKKYAKNSPRFNLFASMAYTVMNQTYEADINIFPDFRSIELRKILSRLTAEELLMLVRQGERATWQRMEMIRTCSKISRTLDNILESYGEEELRHMAKLRERLQAKAMKEKEARKREAELVLVGEKKKDAS